MTGLSEFSPHGKRKCRWAVYLIAKMHCDGSNVAGRPPVTAAFKRRVSSSGSIDQVGLYEPLVLAQGSDIEPATSITTGNSNKTIAAAPGVDYASGDRCAVDMADNRSVGTCAVEEEILMGEVPAYHPNLLSFVVWSCALRSLAGALFVVGAGFLQMKVAF
ncbi:hypothetical protein AF71_00004660 [Rhizobium sp. 57MFTsu3.2]|nr:hypothetical protein [Rhizobium sp. 57MFTsu3.2]